MHRLWCIEGLSAHRTWCIESDLGKHEDTPGSGEPGVSRRQCQVS